MEQAVLVQHGWSSQREHRDGGTQGDTGGGRGGWGCPQPRRPRGQPLAGAPSLSLQCGELADPPSRIQASRRCWKWILLFKLPGLRETKVGGEERGRGTWLGDAGGTHREGRSMEMDKVLQLPEAPGAALCRGPRGSRAGSGSLTGS